MSSGLLEAIKAVLVACSRPLSAKAIAGELERRELSRLGGLTPWKTVGARLAVDIRFNPNTPFMRVGRGMYALKAWSDLTPVTVPARRINPLDEDILVVERDTFEQMKTERRAGQLFDIHYRDLLAVARPVHRMAAEASQDFVQLIPSFVIFKGDAVLSFKRTRKTPEQRLHDSHSIVFGGHLQAEDNPELFANLDEQVERFLFRELYEELSFDPPLVRSQYSGVLHLENTDFERQHAGIVFAVELAGTAIAESLEPGYHSTLQFLPWAGIADTLVMDDRWSATCILHMLEA